MRAAPLALLAALLPVTGLSSPALAQAAPVEVTYSDALRCAAFDGFLAVMLAGENEEHIEEAAPVYYSWAGDQWLNQAAAANPGGMTATDVDFQAETTTLVTKFAGLAADDGAKAFQTIYDEYSPACEALEQASWGGPEGVAAKIAENKAKAK